MQLALRALLAGQRSKQQGGRAQCSVSALQLSVRLRAACVTQCRQRMGWLSTVSGALSGATTGRQLSKLLLVVCSED